MIRTQRRQRRPLGPGVRSQLRFGINFFHADSDAGDDIDALESAWSRLRDEIMRDHARRPGCRPWGYWRFDIRLEIPIGTAATRSVPALLGMTEAEYLEKHNLLTARERLQRTSLNERFE